MDSMITITKRQHRAYQGLIGIIERADQHGEIDDPDIEDALAEIAEADASAWSERGRSEAEAAQPRPEGIENAISSAVGEVLFNSANYPSAAQFAMVGQDVSELRKKITDAVLAVVTDGADRG